ncbi:MAG: glycosyltransferase [Candidatus Pacebacteria bacterium]|nr:glycosyltransferase [Candidatus Paceibacterota bacterium]
MKTNKKLKVLLDTSPLANANSIRGVGMYTRFLTQALEQRSDLIVKRSGELANGFQPDVIHYPYFDLFFNTLPLIKRAKTVVTVHDVIPLKFPDHYPAGVKGKLRFFKQKKALQRVEAVITDSQASQKDILKHLAVVPEKTHVVYLAPNPNLQKTSQKQLNAVRRRYKLPQSYILYVGDINYNKNLPQLIKAVRELPYNIKLVCVGRNFQPQGIPEWQWIEAQLALSDVGKRVKFITDVVGEADQDLSAIYTGALVYVQPSLYEGFGLPVLEAMRCETPVVCARNSSLIEVGGEQVEFVQPQAESIAQGVQQVLSWSAKKRQQRVQTALSWSKTFSWQLVAEQTSKVYHQL